MHGMHQQNTGYGACAVRHHIQKHAGSARNKQLMKFICCGICGTSAKRNKKCLAKRDPIAAAQTIYPNTQNTVNRKMRQLSDEIMHHFNRFHFLHRRQGFNRRERLQKLSRYAAAETIRTISRLRRKTKN